ncbi:MAG: VCBS repeat-containing protein [Planctomycetes bacterium]|nr:VCBS repeat-containing protein [Planctomycetota bacterium]
MSFGILFCWILGSLLIPLGFASCSKKHRGFFGGSMSIEEVQPADGSTDVDPAATIAVKFSASVNSSSVTASSFKVTGSESGAVAGTYVLSENDRRVTYSHAQAFKRGETITVAITKDLRGKSGASSPGRVFSFTIKPPDVVPPPPEPKVTTRAPAPNATHVVNDARVIIEFDQIMDPLSFSSSTVQLLGSIGGRIAATISEIINPGSRRLILTPQRRYYPFERITVILGKGLRSAKNAAFAGETFSFTAAGSPPIGDLHRGPDIPASGEIVELAAADFDLDGLIDLTGRTGGGAVLQIFRNTGKGKYTRQPDLQLPQAALSIAVVDCDGDGRMDILAGSSDRATQFKNQGGFTFQGPTDFGTGTAVRGIASGDIDHEDIKLADLVLDTDRGLKIFLGGLAAAPAQEIGQIRLSRTGLILSDLNRNGFLELLYGDTAGNRISIRSFTPGQGFGPPQELALPNDARDVQVDDLNRDGLPDIVALVPKMPEGGEEILFLPLGGGASANNGESILLPTQGPSQISLADFDGDGWVDILLANQEAGKINYKRNQDGLFSAGSPAGDLLANEPVAALIAFDFTGDGIRDLIAAVDGHLIPLLSEVELPPPDNRLSLSDAQGQAGATDVPVAATLKNDSPIEAFTVVVGFNPAILTAKDVSLAGTVTETLNPDFKVAQLENDQGFFSYNVIFEIMDPFEGVRLVPGEDRVLFKALFDVKDSAPAGPTPLIIPEPGATPPVQTTLSSNGFPVPFTASGSTFTVLEKPPPPPENILSILPLEAKQSDQAVAVKVLISNDSPIDAFTILVGYDAAAMTATAVSLNGTATDAAAPEFTSARVKDDQGYLAYDVIFDFLPPFARNRLLPGHDQLIFKPLFNIKSDAALGLHDLTLPEAAGGGSDRLTLVSDGQHVPHKTNGSAITILQGPPPPENPNKLRFKDLTVNVGSTGNLGTLTITNVDAIDAYTVAGTYNPQAIAISKFDLAGTVTEPVVPEFVVDKIQDQDGYFIYSAIFDFMPPFTLKKIFPTNDQSLVRFVFDVPPDAALGDTTVELKNQVGDPPLDNVFVKDGFSVFPDLFSGKISIQNPPPPPQEVFIRGDVNMSHKVDLADYISLVTYIYKDGTPPACLDTADIDDNGRLEFVDLVVLLDYIFRGKIAPKPPFPLPGPDPTDDQVTCEQGY